MSTESHPAPGIPMFLTCPLCCARHIDEGEFATKVHHTHSCQECGLTWRPAVVPTVGVLFLPSFKSEPSKVNETWRCLHCGSLVQYESSAPSCRGGLGHERML